MKFSGLSLLAVPLLLAGVASAEDQIRLFYWHGQEMVDYGACSPLTKPDGSQLVLIELSVDGVCSVSSDSSCSLGDISPPAKESAGLVPPPQDTHTGYFTCKTIP